MIKRKLRLLDRPVTWWTVAVFGLVAAVTLSFLGVNNWRAISAPPKDKNPYLNLKAQDTPAQTFLDKFVSIPYGDGWTVSLDKSFRNLKNGCIPSQTAVSLVATREAGSADGTMVVYQAYAAGMSGVAVESFVSSMRACGRVLDTQTEQGVRYVVGDNVALVAGGDVVVTLESPKANLLAPRMAVSLYKELDTANCVAPAYSPPVAAARNPFFGTENYTGRQKTEQVSSKITLSKIVTFSQIPQIKEEPKEATLPEAPLPDGFPSTPPKKPTKPSLPPMVALADGFNSPATYQVSDQVGPGCGWSWTGAKSPVFSKGELNKVREAAFKKAKVVADTDAVAYLDRQQGWAFNMVDVMPAVLMWNKWVDDYSAVVSQWNALNAARDSMRPAFTQYLKDLDDWSNWDAKRAEAEVTWNEAVKKCSEDSRKLQEWSNKYGNISAETPSEDFGTIPPQPEGCSQVPPKPEILTAIRPSRPTRPEPPDGVTFPKSWTDSEKAILEVGEPVTAR